MSEKRTCVFGIAMILLCTAVIQHSMAQVTFSRDWNAGKRTVVDNPDLHASMKSATTICHLLVNQIRDLANCESIRNEEADSASTQLFAGRR